MSETKADSHLQMTVLNSPWAVLQFFSSHQISISTPSWCFCHVKTSGNHDISSFKQGASLHQTSCNLHIFGKDAEFNAEQTFFFDQSSISTPSWCLLLRVQALSVKITSLLYGKTLKLAKVQLLIKISQHLQVFYMFWQISHKKFFRRPFWISPPFWIGGA